MLPAWSLSTVPWLLEILAGPMALTKRHGLRQLRQGRSIGGRSLPKKYSRSRQEAQKACCTAGCLSLLCASLGTPYEIRTRATILFVEDLNEPPYRIDRMLMQLRLAGKFKAVRGIIFGEMQRCDQRNAEDYTLQQVVMRVIGDLGIPIAFGLKSGHVSGRNFTLPFGVRAKLNLGNNVVLEYGPAVRKRRTATAVQRS